ncbi:MAG: signal peptidase I [Actinomycetota bacterium]
MSLARTILAPVLERFRVEDRSMEPTLRPGDLVWCRRRRRSPGRGRIVVFPHPRRNDMWLVKRVIALTGDRITIELGDVAVNGDPGMDRWGDSRTDPDGEWEVGTDEVFVLSDNREATRDDSRTFGAVDIASMLTVIFRR